MILKPVKKKRVKKVSKMKYNRPKRHNLDSMPKVTPSTTALLSDSHRYLKPLEKVRMRMIPLYIGKMSSTISETTPESPRNERVGWASPVYSMIVSRT